MIKILKKQKFNEVEKDLKDGMVVISRSGKKLVVHNIETNLPISFDEDNEIVTIQFKIRAGEVVVIGDKDGFEPKREV